MGAPKKQKHEWEPMPTVHHLDDKGKKLALPDFRRRCALTGEIQIELRSKVPGAKNYTYTWTTESRAARCERIEAFKLEAGLTYATIAKDYGLDRKKP